MSLKRLEADLSPEAAADAGGTLRVVCEEAFRCKQITEKLLSLSRSREEGRKPVSLVEVARSVASMVGGLPAYRDRKLNITTAPPVAAPRPSSGRIGAGRGQLRQVRAIASSISAPNNRRNAAAPCGPPAGNSDLAHAAPVWKPAIAQSVASSGSRTADRFGAIAEGPIQFAPRED